MANNLRRELAINLPILLGGVFVITILLWWLQKDVVARTAETVRVREAVTRRLKETALLAELKRTAPEAERYQKQLDLLFPAEDQLFDFRPWIIGLASAYDMGLSVNFRDTQSYKDDIGFNRFTLQGSGERDKILSFLGDIERRAQRFLIVLEGVELTRSGEGRFNFSSQGQVFFRQTK